MLTTAPSATPRPAPATGGLQTIHLIEHPTNLTAVPVASLTGCTNMTSCQGDSVVGYDPMFDAETGKEVGALAFECFIVDAGDTLYHCPGITLTLTGRGAIAFTELFWPDRGQRQADPRGTTHRVGWPVSAAMRS